MTELTFKTSGGRTFAGLSRINVLLGKNGCGKSVVLRDAEASRASIPANVKYLVPERAGVLQTDMNVVQNIVDNSEWLQGTRRTNMVANFMQQAIAQLSHLETRVLRRIAGDKRDDKTYTFDIYLNSINKLLDHVELRNNSTRGFTVHRTSTGEVAEPGQLSSGESQLIALGIESLAFEMDAKSDVENILLMDEPDVHIHPDLQARLMTFLADLAERSNIRVLVATHSTAILGALESRADTTVFFMKAADAVLSFKSISEGLKLILPVFGAHPLSNIFNEIPLLLVEGTDEERIWQQAVRTSAGKIRLYPCEAAGKDKMDAIEKEADKIISSVYDKGVGYSLRDRDDGDGIISALGTIKRFRLQWRASENLLLCDDVLKHWGIDWDTVKTKIAEWVTSNPSHQSTPTLKVFVDAGFPREAADLKDSRNVIAGLIHKSKSWELLVGQAIGRAALTAGMADAPGSLRSALGPALCQLIFRDEKPIPN